MTAQDYKEQLIDHVITQIVEDAVEHGDVTAIHEMFDCVHETVLESYLPEETLENFVNRG